VQAPLLFMPTPHPKEMTHLFSFLPFFQFYYKLLDPLFQRISINLKVSHTTPSHHHLQFHVSLKRITFHFIHLFIHI
jgi:hypothetical protein